MSSLFGSGFGTGQMESELKPNNATVQERTEINKSRILHALTGEIAIDFRIPMDFK